MNWYSKKQAIVGTSTYGSELVVPRAIVERLINLRLKLRFLGVSMPQWDYLLADNKHIIKNTVLPNVNIHKKNIILFFTVFVKLLHQR